MTQEDITISNHDETETSVEQPQEESHNTTQTQEELPSFEFEDKTSTNEENTNTDDQADIQAHTDDNTQVQQEENNEDKPSDTQETSPEENNANKENSDDAPHASGDHEHQSQQLESPIQEEYKNFKISLQSLLKLQDSHSVELVGLRTQEQEIHYKFTKQDHSIHIEKIEDQDKISIHESDDELSILINDEELVVYNNTNNNADEIAHYLNEKFGKFTLMLQTQADKAREEYNKKKKLKEILKNF